VRWTCELDSSLARDPLVVEDTVLAVTRSQRSESAVALARTDGHELWRSATEALEPRGYPATADERLYFGDLEGVLFVLDTTDGTVHTPRETRVPLGNPSPLVGDDLVYTQVDRLEARHREGLDLAWQWDEDSIFEAPLAYTDGQLFAAGYRPTDADSVPVNADEAVGQMAIHPMAPFATAVDPQTGECQWETPLEGMPRGPAVRGDSVVVPIEGSTPVGKWIGSVTQGCDEPPPEDSATDPDPFGGVHALDRATGEEAWFTRLAAPVTTMPAVDDQHVRVGTEAGTVVLLEAATGAVVWEQQLSAESQVWSAPVIAGDAVYLGAGDEGVVAFEKATGERLWTLETAGAVRDPPAIVDGTIFVGDVTGQIYKLV
jgi:outer membrane protein assembly factor BamB